MIALKADLKAKKAELKKLDNELGKLEEQKAAFNAREAEEAKKAELEETIRKLMADGVSVAELSKAGSRKTYFSRGKRLIIPRPDEPH